MYDSRVGRLMALEPLARKYPDLSPYNFASNNPLLFVDPDGQKNNVFIVEDDYDLEEFENEKHEDALMQDILNIL